MVVEVDSEGPSPSRKGGGGGGELESGNSDGQSHGGDGAPNLITGSDVTYAGGGGGGEPTGSSVGGDGGANQGQAGAANTGGGGGGNVWWRRNAGGSGIVVVRFPGSTCASVAPGTNTLSSCVGPANDKVARFTVSGTLTIS